MKEIPEETKKKAIALAKAGEWVDAMRILMQAGMGINDAAAVLTAAV